jgi:hypothetical protein
MLCVSKNLKTFTFTRSAGDRIVASGTSSYTRFPYLKKETNYGHLSQTWCLRDHPRDMNAPYLGITWKTYGVRRDVVTHQGMILPPAFNRLHHVMERLIPYALSYETEMPIGVPSLYTNAPSRFIFGRFHFNEPSLRATLGSRRIKTINDRNGNPAAKQYSASVHYYYDDQDCRPTLYFVVKLRLSVNLSIQRSDEDVSGELLDLFHIFFPEGVAVPSSFDSTLFHERWSEHVIVPFTISVA